MSIWAFDAIGTRWEIETENPLDADAREAVSAAIDDFDRSWSRFRADSLVTALARDGGGVKRPADAVAMLDAYRELSDATGGAVNPLVGRASARSATTPRSPSSQATSGRLLPTGPAS